MGKYRRKVKDTDYIYYNVNPYDEEENDCVCRAICTATGLKYEGVQNLLDITSLLYDCPKLCVCCYSNLLHDILGYTTYYCDRAETVRDIVEQYKNRTLLIRTHGHLTCSVPYATVVDLFDCRDKKATCFWIVK